MIPVFWFVGLSGSGKSTLAESVIQYLSCRPELFPEVQQWQLLDGDEIRRFLGSDIGYTFDERRKSVKIMGLLAKYLSENKVGVIVANISPFHDLRIFMKDNIKYYFEIYCKCSISACIRRDPKGNYKACMSREVKNYIGLDIPFQEPDDSNLVLDTENNTIQDCEKTLYSFLNKTNEGRY